jgi:hypothetical protein
MSAMEMSIEEAAEAGYSNAEITSSGEGVTQTDGRVAVRLLKLSAGGG